MRTVAVLCDRVGQAGGAERYWETVIPALARRGTRILLLARSVDDPDAFDVEARAVAWADETGPPSSRAAQIVAGELLRFQPDAVITASIFDVAVLDVVRAMSGRWLARVHDHRPFCPTGDRVYPQFSAPCSAPMGSACRAATLLRGCVRGPRPASFQAIAAREGVRKRLMRADVVLVSSEHMRATCALNGIAADRLAITPPPLPDAAFASTVQPPPAERTLLFVSRPTPRKGLRSLVRALGRVPRGERPRLVVAGTGAGDDRETQADAARAAVEVVWRGHLPAAALRDAIDAATAVAMPSLWPEPFGLVGIEAQARGRPAIAYRVGGIAEWLGEAGLAVRRGDERALAHAIGAVFDQRRWPAYSAEARRRADAYRLDAHVTRLLELCDAA